DSSYGASQYRAGGIRVADLARRFTAAIHASGKTQTQIAKEAHTTKETVSRLANGQERNPSSKLLKNLAKATGTTVGRALRAERRGAVFPGSHPRRQGGGRQAFPLRRRDGTRATISDQRKPALSADRNPERRPLRADRRGRRPRRK